MYNRKWFQDVERKGVPGYRIRLPTVMRRRLLAKEIRLRGNTRRAAISVMRSIQVIVNINQSLLSNQIMRSDIQWMRRRYKI
jgi:hypothetical protein